jgi:hypothetical protein
MNVSDEELLKLQVEAWKTTVGVQQHFNDIELKIRGLAITVLTAVLAAAAVAIKDGTRVKILGGHVNLGAVIFFIGFVAWMLFYFVDQIWYHRLLMGAVFHAQTLEDLMASTLPGIGLTHRISLESPHQVTVLFGKIRVWNLHSKQKMKVFYFTIAVLLVALVVLTTLGGLDNTTQPSKTTVPSAGMPTTPAS